MISDQNYNLRWFNNFTRKCGIHGFENNNPHKHLRSSNLSQLTTSNSDDIQYGHPTENMLHKYDASLRVP
ncbi:hypothetical protein, partial [Burkholderia sp. GbtcB21]|uniref:hypothetical protein n=1 Tax=Burkholderia sp. GbtcB21 TaxID=2824766 RepID=UPI001C3080F9